MHGIFKENAEMGCPPGMLAHLDGCKLRWSGCPKSLHGEAQEGNNGRFLVFHALAYGRLRRILWIDALLAGSYNDINVWDASDLRASLDSGKWPEVTYEIQTDVDAHGNKQYAVFEHFYFSGDGIYKTRRRIQSTSRVHFWGEDPLWCRRCEEALESDRKGVECLYGILRRQFGVLYHPFRTRDLKKIQNVLYTCAILHNMKIDRRDNFIEPFVVPMLLWAELERKKNDVQGTSQLLRPFLREAERAGIVLNMDPNTCADADLKIMLNELIGRQGPDLFPTDQEIMDNYHAVNMDRDRPDDYFANPGNWEESRRIRKALHEYYGKQLNNN